MRGDGVSNGEHSPCRPGLSESGLMRVSLPRIPTWRSARLPSKVHSDRSSGSRISVVVADRADHRVAIGGPASRETGAAGYGVMSCDRNDQLMLGFPLTFFFRSNSRTNFHFKTPWFNQARSVGRDGRKSEKLGTRKPSSCAKMVLSEPLHIRVFLNPVSKDTIEFVTVIWVVGTGRGFGIGRQYAGVHNPGSVARAAVER